MASGRGTRDSSFQLQKYGVRSTRKLSGHNSGAMFPLSKAKALKGGKVSSTVVRQRGCLAGDIKIDEDQVRDICSLGILCIANFRTQLMT